MGRLIDADNLVEVLDEEREKILQGCKTDFSAGLKAYILVDFAKHVINDAPAVDAEPVRHGHWEAVEYGDGTVHTECSVCGYGRGLPPVRNYCPNCGAKMDKEEEE